jgi:hypothetical protein
VQAALKATRVRVVLPVWTPLWTPRIIGVGWSACKPFYRRGVRESRVKYVECVQAVLKLACVALRASRVDPIVRPRCTAQFTVLACTHSFCSVWRTFVRLGLIMIKGGVRAIRVKEGVPAIRVKEGVPASRVQDSCERMRACKSC